MPSRDPPSITPYWRILRNNAWPASLALAAAAIGFAIHIRDGEYIASAMTWIAVGLGLCVLAAFSGDGAATVRERFFNSSELRSLTVAAPSSDKSSVRVNTLLFALVAIYLWQFISMLTAPPGGWNAWSNDLTLPSRVAARPFYLGILAAALLAGINLLDRPKIRRVGLPLLLAIHLSLGIWMIRHSPKPFIDVYYFQQEGAAALLHAENPYTRAMPDIYAGTEKEHDRTVYGQGLSTQGRLNFGFPYTPVSLLMATAGYALAGDHRYAQAVAFSLAGAFVAYTRKGRARGSPGRVSAAAAAMLLFTPRAFFILGRGWTEPFVICGLAATVFCAARRLPILPIALGIFLATKQYLVFAGPAIYLLVSPPGGWSRFARLFVAAVAVAALLTAPLALWDAREFFHSIWTVQKIAPFREDALSFLVTIFHLTGVRVGAWLPFGLTALATALALWRCPRTPAGFAAGIAIIFLPLIAFNKQAFANYYLLVIAALWCAVAATEAPDTPDLPDPAA